MTPDHHQAPDTRVPSTSRTLMRLRGLIRKGFLQAFRDPSSLGIALVIKELLVLLKDPKSRFVIIGPSVIQLLVFGYAATFDLTDVPFAVYNESPSKEARWFR